MPGENKISAEQPDFIQYPEIIIGLVGAIGVNMKVLANVITQQLKTIGYKSEEIQLSNMLTEILGSPSKEREFADKRLHRLMDEGNALRKITRQQDVLGLLSVAAVRRCRAENSLSRKTSKHVPELGEEDPFLRRYPNEPATRCAYILHQLKTPKEVELLRAVYGRAFFLFGAYASHRTRIEALMDKIAASRGDTNKESFRAIAEALNDRDKKERGRTHEDNVYVGHLYVGQNVEDTYPESDVFIDCENRAKMESSVGRFIKMLFGYQFHTPTKDEFGMFHAMAASRRSADLSRQVGAAIATNEGDIVAVGCNEVPKAGGGMYWEGEPSDQRDSRIGFDSRKKIRDEIINETYHRITTGRLTREGTTQEEFATALSGAQIMDVLEYGRSVHAEMAALMDAAYRGVSVKGGTLYSTTFPCHMCARHIIAAGIKRVVYIEPYPKSKVKELYKDSISVDGDSRGGNVVTFEAFIGFSPRQYLEFFDAQKGIPREGDGRVVEWNKDRARVRFQRIVVSYVLIEIRCEAFLANRLREVREDIRKWQEASEQRKSWKAPTPSDPRKSMMRWLELRNTIVEKERQLVYQPEWMQAVMFPQRE